MKRAGSGNPLRGPVSAMIALLSLALLVPAGAAYPAGRAAGPIRILVPATTSALPFLQIAQGHAVSDADIRVDTFMNHAQALAILLRGDADLLLSGTSQGWENRLDGSPLLMVDTGVWGLASLVGRDPSISGFLSLKGKKLSLPFPGSPLDFQSRALLAHAGLDPDRDVSISYGPFAQGVARLLAGQVDAAALPEPVATSVAGRNGLVRLFEYSKAWAALNHGDGRSPQVSLFCTEAFAASHRALLLSLVDAWREASRAVSEHPAAAARSFAKTLDLTPDVLEEAARRTIFEVPELSDNESRVLGYYRQVAPFIRGENRTLDAGFFFLP